MWVTVDGTNSTEIEDDVVQRILGIYPEEELKKRSVFNVAFTTGRIDFSDLQKESETILIPWQMFFLTRANLNTQIANIENQRRYKISPKLISKRKGSGNVTSKRIIDRLIRQQNFLISSAIFPKNPFCGSLGGMQTHRAATHILSHFGIDRSQLWRISGKSQALEYLIGRVETKNINVSRGVLAHKILPTWQVVPTDVYRSTSGFVIKDDRIPFVFLPNEVNPDEVESRQIYTLVFLLAIIGLGQYDYSLDKDFRTKMLKETGVPARLHAITTELLIPSVEVEPLRKQEVIQSLIDDLSSKLKVSPLALVTTLHMRGIISKREYEVLKPPSYVPKNPRKPGRSPHVSTSVAKFCGRITFGAINNAIQSGALSNVQAQHLIWGAPNKKAYHKYRNELGI